MPSPRLLRKFGLILAALVALYALAGFWLVPRLVVRGLHEYLEVQHHRHVEVGAVHFNPFTMRLVVDRLAIADADGRPLVGFARLNADARLGALFRGGVEFASITLDEPHLRLIERRDGALNIMDLVPPSDPNSPMPKVWIDSLSVNRGDAEFTDLKRATPFEIAVTAFNLELEDFYTRAPRNTFRVTARSKFDAVFAFSGTFGLDPVASQGELHIGNFRAQSIADAGPNLLPFDVPHGTLDVNGRYDYSAHGAASGLVLDLSDLTLHDVGLRAPGEPATWIEIPELQVTDTRVDFLAASAHVGKLSVQGARVDAWLERHGGLNLARLYVPLPDDPSAGAAPASQPWRVEVPEIAVTGADIQLADRGPRRPASFHLAPLELGIRGFTIPAAGPLRVTARTTVNGTGQAAVDGEVSLAPLAGKLALDLAALPLAPLQSYVDGHAAVTLRAGTLRFRGDGELAAGGAVVLDGDGAVDGLRTTDDALGEDLVKWSSLRFAGLHATSAPVSLRIREVVARQPYARVIIASNGKTNLSAVLHGTDAPPATATDVPAAATDATPAATAALPLEIGLVRIEDGSMNFADYSVQPNFATGIHALGGTIRGLSSRSDARAHIELDGKVDRYAPARITGEVNFLAAASFANVKMNFKNLELTGLSPYSGKFAGYWIDKGKMSADLDYHVENRKLDANHHIVVDQLTLGQRVDSKDATHLPVRLGIALLKDKDGVIDLELPVTGSLDDPDFRLGKIVWKVVVNLVSKAVTSPFRLLGSLFGGGEELGFVDFAAGAATLDEAARQKIAALVKALDARPGLSIDVPMGFVPELDTPALAAQKFEADLAERAATRLGADPAETGVLARLRAAPVAYRAMLEAAYLQTFGHAATVPAPPRGTAPEAAATAARAWLEEQLSGHVSVSPRDLEALGAARAAAVQAALLEGTGIDPGRVFIVKAPPQQAAAGRARLQLALR